MKSLLTIVGERLRLLRKKRGLTQEQLGERIDLSQSYIGAVERGEQNLTLDTLDRILKALKVEPEELFIPTKNKGKLNKDTLIDFIKADLQHRDTKEIEVISKLIMNVFNTIDELK